MYPQMITIKICASRYYKGLQNMRTFRDVKNGGIMHDKGQLHEEIPNCPGSEIQYKINNFPQMKRKFSQNTSFQSKKQFSIFRKFLNNKIHCRFYGQNYVLDFSCMVWECISKRNGKVGIDLLSLTTGGKRKSAKTKETNKNNIYFNLLLRVILKINR